MAGRAGYRRPVSTLPAGERPSPVRRRVVCAATLVLGAAVLAWSLRVEPGSLLFYPATFALAAVWVGGALLSGPLRLGRLPARADGRIGARPVIGPVLIGLALAGVFVLGALVVREVPALAERVRDVTEFAVEGSLWLLLLVTTVNGVAEEIFFRGALYTAVPWRPIVVTTALNVAVVLASGNVMLAFAAAVLGVVVGLLRRATGGVLAPILTHLTWSTAMLLALPPLVG